eukprot:sb/3478781/
MGSTDKDVIKGLLTDWCRSTGEPLQCDIDHVDEYLEKLIEYGNVSLVEELLRFLRKVIVRDTGEGEEEWSAVLNGSLQRVQRRVQHDFNGILDIPPIDK